MAMRASCLLANDDGACRAVAVDTLVECGVEDVRVARLLRDALREARGHRRNASVDDALAAEGDDAGAAWVRRVKQVLKEG